MTVITSLESQEEEMLRHVFLDHPEEVGETYFQHFCFAAVFAAKLFGAAVAALVHAIIPCLFRNSASRVVAALYTQTHNRGQ